MFSPEGIVSSEESILTTDEYEAIRLIDYEKLTHAMAASQMDISRTTVTELYETARFKIADSIVNGKPLYISGGDYRLCNGDFSSCMYHNCRRDNLPGDDVSLKEKGDNIMRIAVTYDSGQIFQHFGHTSEFKIYDAKEGKIGETAVISAGGHGHGALASFLKEAGADVLICGGIGAGARNALAQAGIELIGGVSGAADEAVEKYLEGSLEYNPDVQCNHHHHGEGHSCGEHKGGCHGNC